MGSANVLLLPTRGGSSRLQRGGGAGDPEPLTRSRAQPTRRLPAATLSVLPQLRCPVTPRQAPPSALSPVGAGDPRAANLRDLPTPEASGCRPSST